MTKIDVYSGFLGAGKTTLIRKMIAEGYGQQKLVLIENEFGEIGIDGGFLQEAGIEIREMNSGCICCSLVGDFGKALEQVIDQYHPDRILIEPSGVGKLSDVVAAVKKVTGEEVQLGYTVAVADAGKCKVYMRNFGEFYNNQIETASTIVLSRTDSISQEKLDGAVALLREHNAVATMVTTPGISSPAHSWWRPWSTDKRWQTSWPRWRRSAWPRRKGSTPITTITRGAATDRSTTMTTRRAAMDRNTIMTTKGAATNRNTIMTTRGAATNRSTIMTTKGAVTSMSTIMTMTAAVTNMGTITTTPMRSLPAGAWRRRKKFTQAGIQKALEELENGELGTVLRAKGIVPAEDGTWIYF